MESEDYISKAIVKERALFFLDRRIKELEVEVRTQLGMAQAGMAYEERRKAETSDGEAEAKNRQELRAMHWIRKVVMGIDPNDD